MAAVNIREIWKGHPADRSWLVGQRRASLKCSLGCEWEAAQAAPVRQLGISFLTHPSSHAQDVILQMSLSVSPALPNRCAIGYTQSTPISLSEGWAMCLSLLPQTEPRAFDQVVRLVGNGSQPAHSVFIGRNWMACRALTTLCTEKQKKLRVLVSPKGGQGWRGTLPRSDPSLPLLGFYVSSTHPSIFPKQPLCVVTPFVWISALCKISALKYWRSFNYCFVTDASLIFYFKRTFFQTGREGYFNKYLKILKEYKKIYQKTAQVAWLSGEHQPVN